MRLRSLRAQHVRGAAAARRILPARNVGVTRTARAAAIAVDLTRGHVIESEAAVRIRADPREQAIRVVVQRSVLGLEALGRGRHRHAVGIDDAPEHRATRHQRLVANVELLSRLHVVGRPSGHAPDVSAGAAVVREQT